MAIAKRVESTTPAEHSLTIFLPGELNPSIFVVIELTERFTLWPSCHGVHKHFRNRFKVVDKTVRRRVSHETIIQQKERKRDLVILTEFNVLTKPRKEGIVSKSNARTSFSKM